MKLGQQRSEFDQIQIYKELQKAKDLDVNQLTSYMQKILKINFL